MLENNKVNIEKILPDNETKEVRELIFFWDTTFWKKYIQK
jgi:hypothetical protein